MSFSQSIKDEILVQCGRHCCICHKFCGNKIELHHIKPKAEGGPDTIDNCIPLCFECHADQTSYDHRHPKGTKYSQKELILHKENWIKKFSNGIAVQYSEAHKLHDIDLYKRIKPFYRFEIAQCIWQSALIDNASSVKIMEWLRNIMVIHLDPNWEFIDSDIEAVWGNIKTNCRKAWDAAELFNTFFPHGPKAAFEQAERYDEAKKEIYQSSREYVKFIKHRLGLME